MAGNSGRTVAGGDGRRGQGPVLAGNRDDGLGLVTDASDGLALGVVDTPGAGSVRPLTMMRLAAGCPRLAAGSSG